MCGCSIGFLLSCNKYGSITHHINCTLDIIFPPQIVPSPIVERMRGFGCASKFGKLVAWQFTPVFVIERDGWGALDIP